MRVCVWVFVGVCVCAHPRGIYTSFRVKSLHGCNMVTYGMMKQLELITNIFCCPITICHRFEWILGAIKVL
jgi:hypothetical protein